MSELFKLLIIGVYAFLVYKYYKNTTLLLLFTLATILILCNINKLTEGNSYNFASPDIDSTNSFDKTDINDKPIIKDTTTKKGSTTTTKKGSTKKGSTKKDTTKNSSILPISSLSEYQMGPYDNLVLTTGNPKSEYVKLQTDTLSTEDDLCVYQGNENPLKCKKTIGLNIGPSIDGESESPKSLFPFTFNKSSPDCCPSTFSTSSGCVCTTENQRKFINRRGMMS